MQMDKRERSLLGFASALLGFLFIILLKTQGATASLLPLPDTDVPSLIQTEQENQLLVAENDKIQLEVGKYTQGQSALTLANQQLLDAKMNAGLVEVFGQGLRITLDDSKRVVTEQDDAQLFLIHEQYIRGIFNALWNGGAEAIAVNGHRVTNDTEVFCSGSYIQIGGTRQMPPYVIESIGDTNTLKSALNFYYDWFRLGDLQDQNGIVRKIEVLSKVVIPAGKLQEYHYAEPVKEGT